jgi:PAS domain S-box-containing protein
MTIPEDSRLQGVTAERDVARRERAWLTAIIEQMPGGLIIVEAPSGRVLTVNEYARKLLGITDGDSLRGIERAFRPDGSAYQLEEFPLFRALQGETIAGELLEIAGPEGEHVVINVRAAPVRELQGRITGAVSLLEDVTVRAAWDRAERQREFVTNAAHELQTPLAAITSAVEVLQAGAKDSSDRDLFIEHIERQSRRLVRLARALLTLSRAQIEGEEPRTEMVDLRPTLEAIAERMEPPENVSLTVECPPELALVANRELLEQVVTNVVRNAVKYTEQGSVRIKAELHEGRAEIRVVDTGIGISSEALPRVTERFYRGEESTDGFGLGLAIVHSVLDVMGGELQIASQGPGRGTTVTMSLPLAATQVPR